jgi:Uma2 family endonuclease
VVATSVLGEQRVLLQDVSWQLFEHLLAELGETRSAQLTYDQGLLEIMTPLMPHERNNRLIEKLIDILAEELNLNIMSVGSMTCKREDLGRGAEPDSSFYIQNEPLMRRKENADLNQDPPPDLVVEIEYSKSAIDKLNLYAAMGVPEFWRYNGSILRIYQLQEGQYVLCQHSPTFSPIQTGDIPRFLRQSLEIGEMSVKQAFRAWVREQLEAIEGS